MRPREVTVTTEGSRLLLLCAANGPRLLHISWLKDGTPLNTRSAHSFSHSFSTAYMVPATSELHNPVPDVHDVIRKTGST